MRIESIEWDDVNLEHATGHGASAEEINQTIANAIRVRLNKRGRAASHVIYGHTYGGRALLVFVAYEAGTHTVRPITAWEDR